MTADEISRMDYKQLRNTVIELNDNYIKLKRLVEDSLDNIDESNLATTFRKKINGYESQFTIAADKISSKVEHIEDSLKQYSTIEQTADKIEMAVNESREYTDGQTQQLSSTFTMTAGQISTNVVKVQNNVTKNYSSLLQTAEKIEAIVGEYYDKSKAFESSTIPPSKNVNNYSEDELCLCKGKYYYYNKISRKWLEYNPDEGVSSSTTLTAHGLYIRNNVQINGDLITYGTISGIKYQGESGNNAFFKVDSSQHGAIGIFTADAEMYNTFSGPKCIWGVGAVDVNQNVVYMYSRQTAIMGYNTDQKKLYPMCVWDFSSCKEVRGLETESGERIVVRG